VPQIAKAFSPHGNPDKNRRGFTTKAVAWTDDRTAAQPSVACVDCHNSHGSRVGSYAGNTLPLTSYSSANGGYDGGILQEYTTTSASFTKKFYMPTQGGGGNKPVIYSASSALCFDCHLGDNAKAPKTYASFNNRSAIKGYYDAGRWQKNDRWTGSFAYKTAGTWRGSGRQMGSHFGGTSTVMTTTPKKQVSGRCTVCHDPHGVAPGSANAGYYLPALKGTWMTSPYKEDRVAKTGGTVKDANTKALSYNSKYYPVRENPRFNYNNPAIVGAGFGTGAGANYGKGGSGYDGYFIDDNTFGTSITYGGTYPAITDNTSSNKLDNITSRHIIENTTQFAGLCLSCHDGSTAAAGIRAIADATATPTVHVHRTVKGWSGDYAAADIFTSTMLKEHNMNSVSGGTRTTYCSGGSDMAIIPGGYRWSVSYTTQAGTGVQPRFHNFPCSKCHTAHTSKLPRLMKTNCMDVGSGTSTHHVNGAAFTYPTQCGSKTGMPLVCHNYQKSNVGTTSRGWNSKTGW
jgi:hypothetical protein